MAKQSWSATGRRKRSSAQVILTSGTGNITVNGVDVDEYMPYQTLVMDLKQPLVLTNNENRFDITVTVKGGGFSGQTGAIRLGIARALMNFDANTDQSRDDSYRKVLKANGMISRDPRALKKSRKSPQFSKR